MSALTGRGGVSFVSFMVIVGCASAPRNYPNIQSKVSYKEVFLRIKTYMKRCFPNAPIRTNLYTDVSEGELILDEIPSAGFIFAGASSMASYEFARETVNIHFVGIGKQTSIQFKNELSQEIVKSAEADAPCPKMK